jgi:predicted SprT family Zn-dependent metalloprotease
MEQITFAEKLETLQNLWYELKEKYSIELLGYRFELDKAKRRLGLCNYNEKKIYLSRIHIECTNLEEMKDTLKHEVAHAYSYHYNGNAGAGHNHFFYDACKIVGARTKRCASATGDEKEITPKYLGICKVHNVVGRYYKFVGRRSCSLCHPKYDERFLLDIVKYEDFKGEKK